MDWSNFQTVKTVAIFSNVIVRKELIGSPADVDLQAISSMMLKVNYGRSLRTCEEDNGSLVFDCELCAGPKNHSAL